MCEENEKERIINAKSRITKFTFDNEHLTKMIEELKKEISTVEATKVKLLSELEDSDPQQLVSDPILSLSELSDSSSSTVNSDFLVDKSSNNSDSSEYDSTSESPEDFDDSSTENNNRSISNNSENVPSNNLMLDCVNCVESLLSNLKVLKKCLRTDLCENCTRLKNEINILQELEVVSPLTSINRDQKDSSPSNLADLRLDDQNTSTVNSIGNGLSYLYRFFNFMSHPLLFVLICGYIGVLVYTKQANSYIVVTPPQ